MGFYPIDLGTGPHGEPWEIDLRNNGSGWTGTFAGIIQRAAHDILENGQENDRDWFVEVTLFDGTVYVGNIDGWMMPGEFTVATDGTPMIVDCDEVARFRA